MGRHFGQAQSYHGTSQQDLWRYIEGHLRACARLRGNAHGSPFPDQDRRTNYVSGIYRHDDGGIPQSCVSAYSSSPLWRQVQRTVDVSLREFSELKGIFHARKLSSGHQQFRTACRTEDFGLDRPPYQNKAGGIHWHLLHISQKNAPDKEKMKAHTFRSSIDQAWRMEFLEP